MPNQFFAMLFRMKYIKRWGLMRNTRDETLSEHSLEVAFLAHALALLRNSRLGGQVDPARAALLALFHDLPEIITGDLPTPVKYYSPQIRQAYGQIECAANDQLLRMLPEDLRAAYRDILRDTDDDLRRIVKAADKLSAWIKCTQECAQGNPEFAQAKQSTLQAIHEMRLPEAELFLEEFGESFTLSLDALGLSEGEMEKR